MDIASSNFSEDSAVFGGRKNLHEALDNVTRQYRPELIGVATTCLSETMGENMPMMMAEYRAEDRQLPGADQEPALVHVSTPSYRGTHADGFHATVRSLVETLAGTGKPGDFPERTVAVFPGMVSPADLRHLRSFFQLWGLRICLVPDYSDTLDGASWSKFERMPAGGTPLTELRSLNHALASLEFGRALAEQKTSAGLFLSTRHSVALHRLGLPVGLRETDTLCEVLTTITGKRLPLDLAYERGRLVDSYVDAHKYLSEKRAVVYGEADMVVAIATFLAETGIIPVLCVTGERNGTLAQALYAAAPELEGRIEVREGADFADIEGGLAALKPDLLIGSSKGRKTAAELGVPLVRCGFPIHDRIGAQRLQILGYSGTQQLFDRVVNALLERKQESSPIGYSYL